MKYICADCGSEGFYQDNKGGYKSSQGWLHPKCAQKLGYRVTDEGKVDYD